MTSFSFPSINSINDIHCANPSNAIHSLQWPNPFAPPCPLKKGSPVVIPIGDCQCSCCGERITNRNHNPCANCGIMDSDRNRQEATAFYLLGVTSSPLISQLPPRTPFFIYPLAAPKISYYLKKENNDIWIRFVVTLSDTSDDDDITFVVSKMRFVVRSTTNRRYRGHQSILDKPTTPGTFDIRFRHPYYGEYKLDIWALIQYKIGDKTYKKTSPKAALSMSLKRDSFYHEEQLKDYIVTQSQFDKQKRNKHQDKYNKLQLIQLETDDDDYQLVYYAFLQSAGLEQSEAHVIIYKIRNQYRQDAYNHKKEQIFKLLNHNAAKLNEIALYHGTDLLTIIKILHQGFLRQFASRTVYGKGTYFAKNARYSRSPNYAQPDADKFQHLLLCNVICGEWVVGTSSCKIPPIKPDHTHLPYETTVNHPTKPTVFVTYQDDQSQPTYLISFRERNKK